MVSFIEIIELIIVTFAIGYIFSGFVRLPGLMTNYERIKNSIYVAAPAVILHELMHKFVAISFGLEATFKAFYGGLALGVILKLINSPLLILAPGYVTIPAATSPSISAIIAFAGPFTNLLLWIAAYFLLKMKNLSQKQVLFLALTKRINLILFIFNMIPFGPLDGAKVFFGAP